MEQMVFANYDDLSLETAGIIAQKVMQKPDALLCFPAGETSLGTFAELANLRRNGKVDFSQCKLVGLDEWVHLGEKKNENCYQYLKKYLFDPIEIRTDNICFFNGEADDLVRECSLTDQFIEVNGGIDLMLLGLGMNGHVGLNEPGTSFDTYSHVVDLDEVTRSVGQKYFSSATHLSQGITLGMKHMMDAETVIVQVSGQKKSPVVKRLLDTEVTTSFPASYVKRHPNAFLLMDVDASRY